MDMNQKLAELKDRLKNMSQEEHDKLDADCERYIREMPYTYMWGKMLQTEKEMADTYSTNMDDFVEVKYANEMFETKKCQACLDMKEWYEFELVREEQNSVYGDCTAIVTIGEGNLLSVDVKYEHEYGSCQTLNYVEINYCPMCGEKLEGKLWKRNGIM